MLGFLNYKNLDKSHVLIYYPNQSKREIVMNTNDDIDNVLVSFFTKISHQFQRLTGKTNYFLAKCCVIAMTISVLVPLVNYWIHILNKHTDLFKLVLSISISTLNIVVAVCCDEAENQAQQGALHTKPMIAAFVPTEIGRLLWAVLAFIDIVTLPIFLVGAAHPILEMINRTFSFWCFTEYYFISVTPLPPCTSKITEWISGFMTSLKPHTPAEASVRI